MGRLRPHNHQTCTAAGSRQFSLGRGRTDPKQNVQETVESHVLLDRNWSPQFLGFNLHRLAQVVNWGKEEHLLQIETTYSCTYMNPNHMTYPIAGFLLLASFRLDASKHSLFLITIVLHILHFVPTCLGKLSGAVLLRK